MSRYNQAPHLKQDTNGIVTTYLDTMDLFALPGIIKQSPWQLDFQTSIQLWHYLNDILMYPYMYLLKFLPIPKLIKKIIILYF